MPPLPRFFLSLIYLQRLRTDFAATSDKISRLPTKPIFALPPGAGPVPKKRGAGFSNSGPLLPDGKHKYSCDDASHLNLADSWFYNWHSHPDCGKGNTCSEPMCGGRARAAEYVPIINDAIDCKPSCKAGLDPNYKQIWRDSWCAPPRRVQRARSAQQALCQEGSGALGASARDCRGVRPSVGALLVHTPPHM